MMKLNETTVFMNSDDYRDRFKAEYYQTKIRYEKLHTMLVKKEAGTLDFTPKTPIDVFEKQACFMGNYLKQLEIRAEIEGIDLKEV